MNNTLSNICRADRGLTFLEDLSQTELRLPGKAGALSEHLAGYGSPSMLTQQNSVPNGLLY